MCCVLVSTSSTLLNPCADHSYRLLNTTQKASPEARWSDSTYVGGDFFSGASAPISESLHPRADRLKKRAWHCKLTYQSHAPPTSYRAYVGDWVGIRLRKARAPHDGLLDRLQLWTAWVQRSRRLRSSVVHVATFWTARSQGVCIPTPTIWVNEEWQQASKTI